MIVLQEYYFSFVIVHYLLFGLSLILSHRHILGLKVLVIFFLNILSHMLLCFTNPNHFCFLYILSCESSCCSFRDGVHVEILLGSYLRILSYLSYLSGLGSITGLTKSRHSVDARVASTVDW